MVGAGWSSPVARQAHNLKVTGSNPVPATTFECESLYPLGRGFSPFMLFLEWNEIALNVYLQAVVVGRKDNLK